MNTPEYDLAIIGAGAAGLIAADFAVQLGAKTALLEKGLIGGDCTWTGCVPSKSLIKVATVAHDARMAARYGVHVSAPVTDMAQVRAYLRATIQQIYEPTKPEALRKKGMEVLLGAARFLDPHTIEVGTQQIRAKKILINTGAEPRIPALPGLAETSYLTYRRIFDNDRLPQSMLVVGGGPLGCEIAQAYRRLGAQVTVIADRLLPAEEPEVSGMIERVFEQEGVQRIRARAEAVHAAGLDTTVETNGSRATGDLLFIATGRAPLVHDLGLESAKVRYTERGIEVNGHLQTTASHIYAAGDVIGGSQYSHLAGWQGFQAVRNALLPGNNPGISDAMPRVTFTAPEIARIGLTERAARDKHKDGELQVKTFDIGKVDRAVSEDDHVGLLKIIARKGLILGASIVGERAGEAITEIAVAMRNKLKLSDVRDDSPLSDLLNRRTTAGHQHDRRKGFLRNVRPADSRAIGTLALEDLCDNIHARIAMEKEEIAWKRVSPLAMDFQEFRALGYQLIDRLASFLESLPERRVTTGESPSDVRQALGANRSLPRLGTDPALLLNHAAGLLFEHSLFNGHPRFWGYITSSAAPIGALAELLAASVNPNVGAWLLSPMASEIETQTIRWVAEMLGYPPDCAGLFVSGGNMANMLCFLAARQARAGWDVRTRGMNSIRLRVYCSKETHTWIQKAADISGLGTDAIRWIPTNEHQQMEVTALREQLRRDTEAGDRPFLVVGTAGSVSTGAIDPLPELAAICREFNLWFHVDGAYGGLAAVLPDAPSELAAMREADSVAVDPHKWLYAPLEAGCALLRDPEKLRDAFAYHPPYYHFGVEAINYFDLGPQNSRGFRALKVWLALQQVGRDGYVRMISDDIRLAQELFRLMPQYPALQPFTQSLSITTFPLILSPAMRR